MSLAAAAPATARIASIDLIRGAVMILMAIDHVRVYSGLPAGGPTPGIFFTRWITHFCAPAFIFLAGTSAFLYGRRHADLSRFLLVRGLWLVLLELTVIRVAWTFNFDFADYVLAGVIWVIGWCMVLMAGLVRLPVSAVGALGLAVIALHNAVMPKLIPLLPEAPRSILYTAFADPPIALCEVQGYVYAARREAALMAAALGLENSTSRVKARRSPSGTKVPSLVNASRVATTKGTY